MHKASIKILFMISPFSHEINLLRGMANKLVKITICNRCCVHFLVFKVINNVIVIKFLNSSQTELYIEE